MEIDTSKRDRHLEIRDGEYYYRGAQGTETELLGLHCKALHSDNGYFFQFDTGHFTTKFAKVEITEDEFIALRNGDISFDSINNKYKRV